jgi:hypothetical protein
MLSGTGSSLVNKGGPTRHDIPKPYRLPPRSQGQRPDLFWARLKSSLHNHVSQIKKKNHMNIFMDAKKKKKALTNFHYYKTHSKPGAEEIFYNPMKSIYEKVINNIQFMKC